MCDVNRFTNILDLTNKTVFEEYGQIFRHIAAINGRGNVIEIRLHIDRHMTIRIWHPWVFHTRQS